MRNLISLLSLPISVRRLRLAPLLVGAALFAGCGAPAQGVDARGAVQGLASLATTGVILAGGPVMTGRVDVPGTHEQVCASLEADGWTLVALSFQHGERRHLYLLTGPGGQAQYALVGGVSPVQVDLYAGWPDLPQSVTAH